MEKDKKQRRIFSKERQVLGLRIAGLALLGYAALSSLQLVDTNTQLFGFIKKQLSTSSLTDPAPHLAVDADVCVVVDNTTSAIFKEIAGTPQPKTILELPQNKGVQISQVNFEEDFPKEYDPDKLNYLIIPLGYDEKSSTPNSIIEILKETYGEFPELNFILLKEPQLTADLSRIEQMAEIPGEDLKRLVVGLKAQGQSYYGIMFVLNTNEFIAVKNNFHDTAILYVGGETIYTKSTAAHEIAHTFGYGLTDRYLTPSVYFDQRTFGVSGLVTVTLGTDSKPVIYLQPGAADILHADDKKLLELLQGMEYKPYKCRGDRIAGLDDAQGGLMEGAVTNLEFDFMLEHNKLFTNVEKQYIKNYIASVKK